MGVIDRLERARVSFAEATHQLEAAQDRLSGGDGNAEVKDALWHATHGEQKLANLIALADDAATEALPTPSSPPLHPVA